MEDNIAFEINRSSKYIYWVLKLSILLICLLTFSTGVYAVSPSNTLYFSEGYTGTGFHNYLKILNPNPHDAEVLATYFYDDGRKVEKSYSILSQQIFTIYINEELAPDEAFGTKIESNLPIIAENPIYFENFRGIINGGFNSIGANRTSTIWHLSGGYTGPGFDVYLSVLNPNQESSIVNVSYFFSNGSVIFNSMEIGGTRRSTINVNEIVGPDEEVTFFINSDLPIVVEKPVYFSNYGGIGIKGGHNTIGTNSPSKDWYFAGGTTLTGFDEYIPMFNPSDQESSVQVTYFFDDGTVPLVNNYSIPGMSRYTIWVWDEVGRGKGVGAKVESDIPIVTEKAIYFNDYEGRGFGGGHNTIGAKSPSAFWYFAEGYTGAGFDNYLFILNPGNTGADVNITYFFNNGSTQSHEIQVPGNFRNAFLINDIVGSDKAFGIEIMSNQPIVAEKSVFFENALGKNIYGAHNTIGFDSEISYSVFVSRPKASDVLSNKKAFKPGEPLWIMANVTHGDGVSLIDNAFLSLVDPSGDVLLTNESMTLSSSTGIQKTFNYSYDIPTSDSVGTWNTIVSAYDIHGDSHTNIGSFQVLNFSLPTKWIFSKPAEAMVAPPDWLGNPDTCNPNPTQSPQNFRTITISTLDLSENGKFNWGNGPFDALIYDSEGYLKDTLELTGTNVYSGTITIPDSYEKGQYFVRIDGIPEAFGRINVLQWICHRCHMDPQTPSTFDKTTVHNIHRNTKYGNGYGCNHNGNYYGKYCSECHINGATSCNECHGDYLTGHSLLSNDFGLDVHLALSNPCGSCHGGLSSINPSPQCDNPSCHPRPGSNLTIVPPNDSTTHSISQNVPCGACHKKEHDTSRAPDCSECHQGSKRHNESVDCSICHSEESHSIKIMDRNFKYFSNKKQGISCKNCHQGITADSFLGDKGLGNRPKITNNFTHSTGRKWNQVEINQSNLAPIPNGLWHFDKGSGISVFDSSSYGNNGTIQASWTSSGKFNNALEFDGVDDFVAIDDHYSLDIKGEITLAAWIYIKGPNGAGSEWQEVIAKRDNWDGNYIINLIPDTGTGSHWQFAFYNTDCSSTSYWCFVRDSSNLIQLDQWYHMAATYNENSGMARIFLNGTLINETYIGSSLIPNDFPLYIGNKGNGLEPFNGTIDEVAIWDTELSESEISGLFNLGRGKDEDYSLEVQRKNYWDPEPIAINPIGLWHMDEISGNTAYDFSGFENDGSVLASRTTSGKFSQGVSFDGIDDYVQVPHSDSLNITEELTISAWIKRTGPLDQYDTIVHKVDPGGRGYRLWYKDGQYGFSIFSDTSYSLSGISGTPLEEWVNIVGTYNKNNGGDMKFYENGEMISNMTPQIGGDGYSIYSSNLPLQIGAHTHYGRNFQGAIDEVAIWDRELSEDEVYDLYNLSRGIDSDYIHESTPCKYCHGDTKHSIEALGHVSAGLNDPWNIVNGTVTSNQHWCAGCHVENYSFYYGDTLNPVPPGIEAGGIHYPNSGSPYDHTRTIQIESSDSRCFACHAGPGQIRGNVTITEFLHNMGKKKGPCADCHTIHPVGW